MWMSHSSPRSVGAFLSEFDTSNLADLQALMDSYTVHAIGATEPPTLMDIAGFPHWENVYSNILAFVLNTEEAHGFGPLFIRSIMGAYRSYSPYDWPADNRDPEHVVEATDRVEREVSTDSAKRIDILVCIENKIWSGLHNDLGVYREHCEKNSDGRPVLGIVLSPNGVTDRRLQDHRFVSITYGDLVKQVRQRMGSYIGTHNTQYQYLLFDFLEQTSRFARTKTMTDDQREFLDFWKNNEEKIGNIQEMCNAMWRELKAKAQAHNNECWEELEPHEKDVFKKPWIYVRKVSVFDLIDGCDIKGCRIFLDVEFHPLRVSHVLWDRHYREPKVRPLISPISADTGVIFDNSSERPKFVTEQSPFKESVCKDAVKTSVKILKSIAAMRLAAHVSQEKA